MSETKITIALVDDHVVLREGVRALLAENKNYEILFDVSIIPKTKSTHLQNEKYKINFFSFKRYLKDNLRLIPPF